MLTPLLGYTWIMRTPHVCEEGLLIGVQSSLSRQEAVVFTACCIHINVYISYLTSKNLQNENKQLFVKNLSFELHNQNPRQKILLLLTALGSVIVRPPSVKVLNQKRFLNLTMRNQRKITHVKIFIKLYGNLSVSFLLSQLAIVLLGKCMWVLGFIIKSILQLIKIKQRKTSHYKLFCTLQYY